MSERVKCLILLKSPHEDPIYLMVKNEFDRDQVEMEQREPGSSIMNYTYNEKVILTDSYLRGCNVVGLSFKGQTDNNDAFQFVRAVTEEQANEIVDKTYLEEEWSHSPHGNDHDYEELMHWIFPETRET